MGIFDSMIQNEARIEKDKIMSEVISGQRDVADEPDKLLLRSWPKMLFFWPSALVALLAGIGSSLNPAMSERWEFWGTFFLIVFALNLLILTFDFPRSASLTLVLVCIALAWIFVEVNRRYNIIAPLRDFIESLQLAATPDFYYTVCIVYLLLLLGMFISTRFSYWEVTNNELVHHKGLMQDVERYATAGLHYSKEITDFFEYLIGRSGRLIIISPSIERPVVLSNVITINRVAAILDRILENKRVIVSNQAGQPVAVQQPVVVPADQV